MDLADALAHQGGWDEALFVAVPVLVFFGLLILANRRASALRAEDDAGEPAPPSPTDDGTPAASD